MTSALRVASRAVGLVGLLRQVAFFRDSGADFTERDRLALQLLRPRRLKARFRPMRGLKRFRSAARLAAGHAFVQNLRRGHYELATDVPPQLRLATAFTDLAYVA
jgi:hypothetical protein